MPRPKALVATITRTPPTMNASCTSWRLAAPILPWYRPEAIPAASSAACTSSAAFTVAV